MVNVGDKPESLRTVVASGRVTVNESTFALIKNGGMKKGDVLAVAHVLKPPEGLQGRCRLHKIPPSELGGFLKRLANRRWNSSAFHAILCAFAPIYARTTVFAA